MVNNEREQAELVNGSLQRNGTQISCPFLPYLTMQSKMGQPIRVFVPCNRDCAHFELTKAVDGTAAHLSCGGTPRVIKINKIIEKSDPLIAGSN